MTAGAVVRASLVAVVALRTSGAAAQPPAAQPTPRPAPPGTDLTMEPSLLVSIGSPQDERRRVGQLLGTDSIDGSLLRSAGTLTSALGARRPGVHVRWLLPEVRTGRNSALPTPENDGALWAGRGLSTLVRGGTWVQVGPVRLVLAPELAYAQNLGFQSTGTGASGQFPPTGPYAAPWFTGDHSADLPIRFGDQSYTTLTLGQSALSVEAGPVTVGVTTENEWWGPGARNALLLSDAAEGVPRAFLRTTRPVRTRFGDVEARWMVGALTPSLFHSASAVDRPFGRATSRSLSGAAATFRPGAAPGLALGVARVVVAPVRGGTSTLARAFDAFVRADHLGPGDTLGVRRSDQLTSVFARWVFPGSGAEMYGEFGWLELPRSGRDLLLAPQNTGAFTLGVARAWQPRRGGALVTRLELTNLEQSQTFTDRPPTPDWYTTRSVAGGFTNRGQPLGAAIGPGSSSQWASVDWYGTRLQLGAFARRVRWQNDALYRQFLFNDARHDVSLGGGVRAGWRFPHLDARAELGVDRRLNWLFQNGKTYTFGVGTVDVRNLSLRLDLTPRNIGARGQR
jgi:hypothetical protein